MPRTRASTVAKPLSAPTTPTRKTPSKAETAATEAPEEVASQKTPMQSASASKTTTKKPTVGKSPRIGKKASSASATACTSKVTSSAKAAKARKVKKVKKVKKVADAKKAAWKVTFNLSDTETSDMELSATEVDDSDDEDASPAPSALPEGLDLLLVLAHASHYVEVINHKGILGLHWADNATASLNLLAEVADKASALQERGVPLSTFVSAFCVNLVALQACPDDEDVEMDSD